MIKALLKRIIGSDIVRARELLFQEKRFNEEQNRKESRVNSKLAEICSQSVIKLELGAGDRKGENGWVTVDLHQGADLNIDLRRSLPFASNSIDEIYSSHFLEHFTIKDIVSILSECYRVLKPGGCISSCVPDASIYIKAYCNNTILDRDPWFRYEPAKELMFSKIDYINYIGHLNGEHKHMFDQESLIEVFKQAGFVEAQTRGYDINVDMETRRFQSIYVTAKK